MLVVGAGDGEKAEEGQGVDAVSHSALVWLSWHAAGKPLAPEGASDGAVLSRDSSYCAGLAGGCPKTWSCPDKLLPAGEVAATAAVALGMLAWQDAGAWSSCSSLGGQRCPAGALAPGLPTSPSNNGPMGSSVGLTEPVGSTCTKPCQVPPAATVCRAQGKGAEVQGVGRETHACMPLCGTCAPGPDPCNDAPKQRR